LHARATTGTVDLAKAETAVRASTPGANPITRQPGFRGSMTFLDRQTGEGMFVGLWESEADLQASQAMHDEGQAWMVQQGIWASPPTARAFEVIQKNDPQ
jgi:heme-degrading monooxygenase HmoA